jgi:hypothetical protein
MSGKTTWGSSALPNGRSYRGALTLAEPAMESASIFWGMQRTG